MGRKSRQRIQQYSGFDACLMGSLECMNLWSDYADYFVGSEELEPGDGWDYTFLKTLNITQDPEDVTSQVVESFGKYYEERRTDKYDPDVTLSAVNLLEVKHLINDIGDFSSMLSQELEKGRYSSLQQVRAGAKSFGAVKDDEQNELYYYDLVDVYSLASGMEEIYSTESGALKQQIEKTVTAPFILNSHIKKIEPGAFCDCVYLEEFKMVNENDFYTVKDGMLYSKDEKTLIACPTGFKGSIIIPEGTEEIGEEAFLGNHDLQEVYIPKTVRQIKESAFRSAMLKKVQFSEGLLSIGNSAFQGNYFTEIIFPDTLEEIGEDAFSYCYDLRRICFSENLETIGNNAFWGCNKIEQVKLPDRLEFIGDTVFADGNSVFSSSTQDTLVIGKELKAMGNAPFGSIAVRNFEVDPDNPNFSDVDGFLTDKTGRILLECPAGRKGIITIPEGIEIIANYAFYYAIDVTDLKLPDSLTSIEVLALHDKLKEREKNETAYEAN